MRRTLLAAVIGCLAFAGAAQASRLHVQPRLSVRDDVRLTFSAPALPEGGYYYAVVVLRRYRHYTRKSPPPCSTSSDMQRTDYGYPQTDGVVALALTPSRSRSAHWCRGGSYEGAVYSVPHRPACNSSYPCISEPYELPCAGVGPGCVLGVVAKPTEWTWPDPLPSPRARGTTLLARFSLRFPSR